MLLEILRPHLAHARARWRPPPRPLPLTRRQHQLLRWVAEGLTNEEIAARLWISEHTVRKHLENINRRLGGALPRGRGGGRLRDRPDGPRGGPDRRARLVVVPCERGLGALAERDVVDQRPRRSGIPGRQQHLDSELQQVRARRKRRESPSEGVAVPNQASPGVWAVAGLRSNA